MWIVTPEKYLTEQEVLKLKKVASNLAIIAQTKGNQIAVRNLCIIEVALGSGLRVSEMANLKLEDLHFRKGQHSITVRNGKGNRSRVVAINNRLKSSIQKYLDYRLTNSPYLFYSERGNKMTRHGISKVFKKLVNIAGISNQYSIHSLRHTYATNLYKASGYNLRLVQKQLGHANITTTTVYSDVISKDLEDAVENLK